jgi:hypothetical protein
MKKTLLLLLALFVCASGCTAQKTVQKTESIMGTDVTITVVAGTERRRSCHRRGMAECGGSTP